MKENDEVLEFFIVPKGIIGKEMVTAPTISFNKNQRDLSDELSPTSNYY